MVPNLGGAIHNPLRPAKQQRGTLLAHSQGVPLKGEEGSGLETRCNEFTREGYGTKVELGRHVRDRSFLVSNMP